MEVFKLRKKCVNPRDAIPKLDHIADVADIGSHVHVYLFELRFKSPQLEALI